MSARKFLVISILLVLLIGCGGGAKESRSAANVQMAPGATMIPISEATNTPVIATLAAQQPTRANTPEPTATLAPRPTAHPPREVMPIKYGPFVLSREVAKDSNRIRQVLLPNWIKLSDNERVKLVDVQLAYQKVMLENDNTFYDDLDGLTNQITSFLSAFPDTDGSIPTLMMRGNSGGYGDPILPANIRWHEYDRAIQLLIARHPERIPYILDDLIDMGMQIEQIEYTDAGVAGEVLLFTVKTSGWVLFGSLDSFVYSLVHLPNKAWKFQPIDVPHDNFRGDYSTIKIHTLGDINNDIQIEVVVEKHLTYASHKDLLVNVHTLSDGMWSQISSMGPYYDGQSFWVEDPDGNKISDIVIYYLSSPGEFYPRIAIWQWDPNGRTYTDKLPIMTQVCGYHAFAEAERRFASKDFEGAIPWYRETRRRWLDEAKSPNEICKRGPEPDPINIGYAFLKEIESQGRHDMILTPYLLSGELILRDDSLSTTQTITSTTTISQTRANIYQCNTPECNIVARHFIQVKYDETWRSGERAVCSTGNGYWDIWRLQAKIQEPYILVSHWSCDFTSNSIGRSIRVGDVEVIDVCAWDGKRFKLSGSRIIPRDWQAPSGIDYMIESAQEILPRLVDCSGVE